MPIQSERRNNAGKKLSLVPKSHAAVRSAQAVAYPIKDVQVSAYTIPTDFPESDGTLAWDQTTIVIVHIRAGEAVGLGYTYADAATAKVIENLLAGVVKGKSALDVTGCWHAMLASIRNLGRPGVASMAISAVDIALWDLKARLLDVPLAVLLGVVREEVPVYGSGGFTSYSAKQLQSQFAAWVSSGISMVKMKVGTQPHHDIERVCWAREAIGPKTELFVDANGAYSRTQAMAFADRFEAYGVSWFEEPVTSDDLEGLRLLRDRAPAVMDIAAGEYGYDAFYFRRMLSAGAVDVLQADATRCGGITGFVLAGALCFADPLPLSAHTAPAVHCHLGWAVQPVRHLEYFHDHVRIEEMFFEGLQKPVGGKMRLDRTQPGLGLSLRQAEARRYLIT